METEILKFNEANKSNDFELMKKAKDATKNIYLKFLELLKLESSSNQKAFKEALD